MGSYLLSYLGNSRASYQLPSIRSLSLDLPSLSPAPIDHAGTTNLANFSYQYNSHKPPPNSSQLPALPLPSDYKTSPQPPLPPVQYCSSSTPGVNTQTHLVSPIASPRQNTSAAPLSTRSRSSSDPAAFGNRSISPLSQNTSTMSSPQLKLEETASLAPASKSDWKPRKKRQCPECKLFFSNLATHKSTHLKPTSRPHICKYCNRGFARPNDLFRHIKCHWKEIGSDKGQFKCPFKNSATGDHCCHSSGIFSRCDTFKNHLKAIHFQYPNGTKKEQRNKVNGHCRMCQEPFVNVDSWMVNHIEKNLCPYANDYKK